MTYQYILQSAICRHDAILKSIAGAMQPLDSLSKIYFLQSQLMTVKVYNNSIP